METETIDEIMEATHRALCEHGYADLTVQRIAFFVSNVTGATIAWLWFRRGTWRDGDVRGTPGPGPSGLPGEGPEAAAVED